MNDHFLICGWGPIAQRHARNLRMLCPSCRVTVLRRSGAALEDGFSWARRANSLEEALAESPSAAIVATPATQRLVLVQELSRRHIPILLEKPLAANLEDGLQMRAAIGDGTVLLGYNLRFHAPLRMVQESLYRGEIGRPLYVRAEVGQYLPDWRPGRDYTTAASARADMGGGALLELSHEIDLTLWLLGAPQSVQAWTGRLGQLHVDVEDTAEITARFPQGALASIHLDFLQRVARRQLAVVGEAGTLLWDLHSDQARRMRPNGDAETLTDGRALDRNEMYLAELRHFLACVEGTKQPLIGVDDGLRVLRVIDAVRRASASGQTVNL